MKKILFVVNVDWFLMSHRFEIVKAALADGYETHILTRFTEYESFLEQQGFHTHHINIDRSSTSIMATLDLLRKFVQIFKEVRPDLVHLITIKPVILGGIAARIVNIHAVVASISGLGTVFIDNNSSIKRLELVKRLYKYALSHKNINVIFQNSEDLNTIKEIVALKDSQITLIKGSGVNLHKFEFKEIPKGIPIVMFASRLLKDKGILEFVDSVKIIKTTYPNIQARFVVVGKLDYDNNTSITEAQLNNWIKDQLIEYWGYKNDMSQVIKDSSIIVLPSYREGFPKVLIEASAIGRPIITTDVPGCRDAIIDQKTGILVSVRNAHALSEAIFYLVNNKDIIIQMGLAARKLAEKEYDVNKVVEKHLKIYKSLL